MIDQATQLAIQQEVKNQLVQRDRLNAGGMLFDQNTGLHTQGKNLVGLTGDRAIHNVIRTNLTRQTIASGVIQFSSGDIAIDTESAAASDDLDTIVPLTLAQGRDQLILSAYDDTHTVVIKNGTGNIVCGADVTLDSKYDRAILQWDKVNSKWVLLASTNNA